jgi:hypothetical protein
VIFNRVGAPRQKKVQPVFIRVQQNQNARLFGMNLRREWKHIARTRTRRHSNLRGAPGARQRERAFNIVQNHERILLETRRVVK